MILKSFPRGGKKPDIKPSNTLFSKRTKIKSKKPRSKPKSTEETLTEDEPLILNKAENFRLSALHEGMIILGRIFKVTDYYAVVTLPGPINVKLQATEVSENYTALLKKVANNEELSDEFRPLTEIYKVGDYVVCYIKEINHKNKSIMISIEPQMVNQNLNPSFLKKTSKVVLTIDSIEDHGYVMATGLKNFRAFLSTKDLGNADIKLYPGKQIICVVKDIEIAENVYTAKVSIKPKHLEAVEANITSLDSLFPGALVSLSVKKVLKNGLQVYFGENNVGYINVLYLNKALSSFKKGQQLIGTLLYITTTEKFAYFSLLPQQPETESLAIGDIITKAKVTSLDTRGIIVRLKKGVRGFITHKRTEVEPNKIPLVFATDSVHKCKVLGYDSMARVYTCTMEKKLMEQKFVNKANLIPGEIMEVKIDSINKKTGYITVSIGKLTGLVPQDQISDPGIVDDFKIGQKVTARIMETSKKLVFTLKKSLVESKLPILCKLEDAKVGSIHDGAVVKITNHGVMVRFFGGVRGFIPKRSLGAPRVASQKWNLVLGQTVSVVISKVKIDENQITVALTNSKKSQIVKYKIGEIVEGLVTDSSPNGISLQLKNGDQEDVTAFLPAGHMSPCLEVGKLLAAKTVAGEVLSAVVFSIRPSIILSTTFAPEKICKINELNVGDTLLCSVKMIRKESVKVLLPILKSSKLGTIAATHVNSESIYEHQLLFSKILKVEQSTKEISLTTKLSEVWKDVKEHDVKMMTAVDVLSSYLNKLSELSKNIYYTSKPISKINIGQRIKGTVENVMHNGLILKLDQNVRGIANIHHCSGKYEIGDEVEGSVLWVNYPNEYVEVTLLHTVMNSISVKQNKLAKIPIGEQLRGEIVLVTDWFVLVVLKGRGKGTLASLPSRRHLNDVTPDLSPYKIGKKVRVYGVLNASEAGSLLPICMVKSAFEIRDSDIGKLSTSSKNLKRKADVKDQDKRVSEAKKSKQNVKEGNTQKMTENQKNIKIKTEKKVQTNEAAQVNGKSAKRKRDEETKISDDLKSEDEEEENETIVHSTVDASSSLTIPECGFKWDNSAKVQNVDESSSSSDEGAEECGKPKKKKKLSAADRRELERQKEREIREREEALASCQMPQTVDQFDRLVLSSPDSSLVWMQYMAYHLQATEIEKSRAVARRALKTINFREEDERLNVWQAWLNLESRFGTTDSLNEVFQEAVKTNDARKIYNHMLTVHTDAGRQAELEKLVNAMIAKFKQDPETWINCGAALLKIGLKDKSRHTMQRALQSLPDNKHIDIMVRFAQLENKFGDRERSQTLFEQILSSYPKRTDIWSCYVDSLVKSEDIEIARKVLERAITQVLPAKKMKVLFKKYISFEGKHGTPENVSRIQELAVKYVEEQCNKNS